jgi:hypothetical protein
MSTLNTIISPFVPSQFPSFYNDQGPNFIAFVKAYYEWLEQEGLDIQYNGDPGIYSVGDVITNENGSTGIVNLASTTRSYIQLNSVIGPFYAKDIITNQNKPVLVKRGREKEGGG